MGSCMATHVSMVWAGHSMGRPQGWPSSFLASEIQARLLCPSPRRVPRVLLWLVRPGPRNPRSPKDSGESKNRSGRSIKAKHKVELADGTLMASPDSRSQSALSPQPSSLCDLRAGSPSLCPVLGPARHASQAWFVACGLTDKLPAWAGPQVEFGVGEDPREAVQGRRCGLAHSAEEYISEMGTLSPDMDISPWVYHSDSDS